MKKINLSALTQSKGPGLAVVVDLDWLAKIHESPNHGIVRTNEKSLSLANADDALVL